MLNVSGVGDIVQQAAFLFGGAPGSAVTLHEEIVLHFQLEELFRRGDVLHEILHDPGTYPFFDGILWHV
jgi:hypothetical protein